MSIPKFRLAWKGGAQEQMNILEKMALLLENILIELQRANGTLTSIDNGVTSVDGKMSTQLLLSQEIVDNTSCACNALKDVISNQIEQTQILNSDLLLSQQIADNTSCACNALGDVNDKLDTIIDLIETPNPPIDPTDPVYEFVLNTNEYTITEADIQNGYFEVKGVSTKDGLLFDSLTTDLAATWIGLCSVLPDNIIRIGIFRDQVVTGLDTSVVLTQNESLLFDSLKVVFSAVPVIADAFQLLTPPAILPYLDTRIQVTLDVLSYKDNAPVPVNVNSPWSVITSTTLVDSLGRTFYRLVIQLTGISSFAELRKVTQYVGVFDSLSRSLNVELQCEEWNSLNIDPYFTNYTAADGRKGINPLDQDANISFYLIQNYNSYKNGGVQDVDWRFLNDSITNWTIYLNSDMVEGQDGIICTLDPAVHNQFQAPAQYCSLVYPNDWKFIVDTNYSDLFVHLKAYFYPGFEFMLNDTFSFTLSTSHYIPLADCPALHPGGYPVECHLPSSVILLPDSYVGSMIVGDAIDMNTDMTSEQIKEAIGYNDTPLYNLAGSWAVQLEPGAMTVRYSYRLYLIVDKLACWMELDIHPS